MSASRKIAVVTGSNKGIGFAIVKNLAQKFRGIVYLTARNEELGKKALDEIQSQGISNVKYHQLDIGDDQSIERFAHYIKDTHGGLDVLINNAAIAIPDTDPRPIGEKAAETIRINYTATVKLSHALFPLLRPHARVVNLASTLGRLHNIKNDELTNKLSNDKATEQDVTDVMHLYVKAAQDGTYGSLGFPTIGAGSYIVSKVGLIAVTRIHQRLFDKDPRPDILINSVCPGYVKTDMSQHRGFLTPDQGAETPIFLALIPENSAGPRGEFYSQLKPSDWFSKEVFIPPK